MSEPRRGDRLYRTEAIVLSGVDFKEADRILTLYTREQGKIGVIAKGIRKPGSRLGYGLDQLSRVRVMLARGRELDVVTNVELVDGHLALSGDLKAYSYASHMAELVNRMTKEREEQRKLFDLLAGALSVVSDGVDPFAVARYFEISLYSALGYRIEMYHCVRCGRDLQPVVNSLSPRLGGFLCPSCDPADATALALSVNAQKYLRLLDREGLTEIIHRLPGADLRSEVEQSMLLYARYYCERELTSLAVLRSMQSKDHAGSGSPVGE
jgi:DNA repair protein RecO (recombination protein O)